MLIDVLVRVIKFVSNRDKLLKIIQYTCKLIILKRRKTDVQALRNLASALSLSRLVYRLGDWLDPLNELINGKCDNDPTVILENILSLANSILDDIVCLHKCTKGLLPNHFVGFFELWASQIWLFTIIINLWRQLKGRQKAGWTMDRGLLLAKLSFDAIFCSYDIGWLAGDTVPILAGLGAALAGASRAIIKLK